MKRSISITGSERGVWLSRIRNYLRQPHIIVSIVLLVLLFFIIIIPFFKMIEDSFVWQFADTRLSENAIPGNFTVFHWKRVFASSITKNILHRPLLNSLSTSLSVSFFAILIGSLLAWLVTRTDLPFRKTIATIAVLPYVIPSYIHALAWLTLFKNDRIGGAAGMLQFLTGASPPDWVSYGFFPIVCTLSLHYFPFTFLLVSAALSSIDSRLEESGEILGASTARILWKITFPLVLPALLSSFILTFSRVVGTFGTPYFLGAPVRYFTLSTQIYTNIINRIPSTAYILSFVLVAISSVIIYFNQRFIGEKKSFVTIAGKGFTTSLTPLGRIRYPLVAVVVLLLIASVLLPFVLLAWQTLTLYPDDYSFDKLTTLFWIGSANTAFAEGEAGILRNFAILGAAWNSIKLALVASITSGMLGIFIGYAVVKGRNTKLSKTVEQMSFLPYLIPGIAFGALYLSLFTHKIGPIPALYGTFFLVALVCISKNLPFTGRAGITSMLQIGSELEEASETLGASWFMRFRKIILPLSIHGALSGFILVFITVMRELSLIILLVTPSTRTLTTMTFRYQEQGYTQFSSAISVLIIIIVVAGELFSRKLGKKDGI
ncbi:MAG: iron ABC transporter permease [Deltaproteobacteria bacterium]|nr:iron ABC transporter permease [Deltaproteobacteria bacterium]